jgi:hypothetical protein
MLRATSSDGWCCCVGVRDPGGAEAHTPIALWLGVVLSP